MCQIEEIEKRYSDENANLMEYNMHSLYLFKQNIVHLGLGISDGENIKGFLSQYKNNFMGSDNDDDKQNMIEKLKEKIVEEKEKYSRYLAENEKKELPDELKNCEIVKNEQRLALCLASVCECETYEEHYADLCAMSAKSLREDMVNGSEDGMRYNKYTIEDYEKLLEYCRIDFFNVCIDNLRRREIGLDEYIRLCNVMDFKSPLNIYRQSFIVLMTAFDAAVFDLAKVIMERDFFDFCNKNADKLTDNYKLKDIVKGGSFEAFQADVVEKILKNNYVSGLLKMLHSYKKDYFIIEARDVYQEICEIIARRNLHVHKRGIVDQEYLKQSYGNKYNFKCGDIAYIKSSYYIGTSAVLDSFIKNICLLET